MLLKSIDRVYKLEEIPPVTIKEIQGCLVLGNYLLKSQVTGELNDATKKAFEVFKEDVWMANPEHIGSSSAKALLELKNRRKGTKEASVIPKVDLSVQGTRTGKQISLPTGELIYENQFITQGIPLTWGEVTACCERVPTTKEQVQNAINLTRAFGWTRNKFDSPILITSGFRPPRVNRAVGGVSNSQHLYFKALDMAPLNGKYRKLWQCLRNSPFTGLGDGVTTGKGFYHGDVRNGRRIIFGY